MKKWLSYREADVLGRALTTAEARDVTAMVRRLAAVVLMQPELDANYRAVLDSAYPWQPSPRSGPARVEKEAPVWAATGP